MSKIEKRIDDVIPGQTLGIKVTKTKRHPEGDVNRAILKWKRIVKDAGILETAKDLQEYKKRSVRRREVHNKAVYLQKRYNENNF
jgi:ribosomal protein S21